MIDRQQLTRQECELMSSIAKRAKELYDPIGYSRDVISWYMDVETVHLTIGLDLERLLAADDGNFGHDLSGIAKHLNRETKQLEDCFSPRYATRKKEVDTPGPWRVSEATIDGSYVLFSHGTNHLFILTPCVKSKVFNDHLAALIASAPTLLAERDALHEALKTLQVGVQATLGFTKEGFGVCVICRSELNHANQRNNHICPEYKARALLKRLEAE